MLGAMCALGAISSDIYLPALPDVQADLHSSAAAAQFTITAMMIGGAVGQLVIGPLSDRFGRRRPALIGIGAHVLVSLLCAFAPAMGLLIVFRGLQGFFNAAAGVVAIAIIRDRFVGADASRLMSRLMLVIGVAPLFAPTIGGYIGGWVSWRGIFVALAAYGAGLLVLAGAKLPESLPSDRRIEAVRSTWKGYPTLMRDREFVALGIVPALCQGVLMSYVVASPYVFLQGHHLSTGQFGLLFAINGAGLILGSQVSAGLVRRFSPAVLLRAAAPVLVGLTAILFTVSITRIGGLIGLLVALFTVCFFINICPPNASTLALGRHGRRAGTAAAWIGFLQSGLAGAIAPLVGVFGLTSTAMSAVMLGSAAAALAVLTLGTPLFRRGGAARLDRASLRDVTEG
jgi:DHA1 family bicyclomycin/chloramphenicol resistance-like MFS transporter